MLKRMAVFVAAGLAVGTPNAFADTALIDCSPAEGQHGIVRIALSDRVFDDVELSCIYADFIVDMQPCAPKGGGFGMSYPTGEALLRAVTRRWQDLNDHMGGVVGHGITAFEILFDGGFMFPDDDLENEWAFAADRITGEGRLDVGGETYRYDCAAVTRRF